MNHTPFLLRDRVEVLARDPDSSAFCWREGFVVSRTLEAEPRYSVRTAFGIIVDALHDIVRPTQNREKLDADQ
ncbi:MAG: hypothetical protein O2782_21350 [bacterium]|nr:hypothetical protein [bacterium]